VEGPKDYSQDLDDLQREVDSLTFALEEARGQMAEDEMAMASLVQLVDDVQERMDELMLQLEVLEGQLGEQGGELEALRAQLEQTSAQLAATRDQLFEALLQLEYAKGRQDGTQVFVNLTSDDLAGVLVQLSDAISQMEVTQGALADAVAQLLSALGGGPPPGYALPKPHLAHYQSPLINFQCRMCHNANPVGDLAVHDDTLYFNGSLSSVDFRVQIDETAVCSACHDWFPLGEMDPEYRDRNCVQNECHDDWRREMNSPYVNEASVGTSDCLLCHGGQPFYPR
jgi:hypothetical protein